MQDRRGIPVLPSMVTTRVVCQVWGFAPQVEVGSLEGVQTKSTKMITSLETMSYKKVQRS